MQATLYSQLFITHTNINMHEFISRCLCVIDPFAATGGRIVTSLAHELRRSKKRYGLISICAAGGIGGVAILERHDQ